MSKEHPKSPRQEAGEWLHRLNYYLNGGLAIEATPAIEAKLKALVTALDESHVEKQAQRRHRDGAGGLVINPRTPTDTSDTQHPASRVLRGAGRIANKAAMETGAFVFTVAGDMETGTKSFCEKWQKNRKIFNQKPGSTER